MSVNKMEMSQEPIKVRGVGSRKGGNYPPRNRKDSYGKMVLFPKSIFSNKFSKNKIKNKNKKIQFF